MKPELEHIDISSSSHSFQYFKIETDRLTPYWHYHPELELTLIKKGKGTRFIGDSIAPFFDMDLVLVGENLPHHWVTLNEDANDGQECYVFQFSFDLINNIKECAALIPLLRNAKKGILFNTPSEQLTDAILQFENLNNIQRFGALLDILNELHLHKAKTFLTSESYNIKQRQTKSQLKFANINNYILEHLDEKLTVDDLANIAYMVPQSFCRWFKQHSGHSFVTFLNMARVEKACQLLITSDLAIKDIAYVSGFETLSHFNRTFKKIKECSPSKFKNENIN